jgi:hypothetical protein
MVIATVSGHGNVGNRAQIRLLDAKQVWSAVEHSNCAAGVPVRFRTLNLGVIDEARSDERSAVSAVQD